MKSGEIVVREEGSSPTAREGVEVLLTLKTPSLTVGLLPRWLVGVKAFTSALNPDHMLKFQFHTWRPMSKEAFRRLGDDAGGVSVGIKRSQVKVI